MKKRFMTVLLYLLLFVLIFSIGSCKYFGFINPAWALEGSWTITQHPDVWTESKTFVFLPDASGYQIKDPEGTVFESGPITALTDSSFNYTMEQYDPNTSLVGSENYAEYVFADTDTISISFYADPQKSIAFGTLTAIRN